MKSLLLVLGGAICVLLWLLYAAPDDVGSRSNPRLQESGVRALAPIAHREAAADAAATSAAELGVEAEREASEGGGLASPATDARALAESWAAKWVVEVVDRAGEPLFGARIRAVLREHNLEGHGRGEAPLLGTGRCIWERPRAGTWTLVVECDELEHLPWTGMIELVEDQEARTVVTLAEDLRILGVVRDALGAPYVGGIVGFARGGAPAPREPEKWHTLPRATTAGNGTFEVRLPSPGTWRLFVTHRGSIVFEEEVPQVLEASGPSRVEVVIPTARLLLELPDAPGAFTSTGREFSVYRAENSLDTDRALPRTRVASAVTDPAGPFPPPGRGFLPTLPIPDISAADLARIEAANNIIRRQAEFDRVRAFASIEGWRAVHKGFVLPRERASVSMPPTTDELRLAVTHGAEVLLVEGRFVLAANATTRVRIALPAPLPATAIGDGPRTVPMVVEVLQPEDEPRPVGAVWR